METNKPIDELKNWDDIKKDFLKHSLLIGNGASCAVWEKFHYHSIYEEAKKRDFLSSSDIEMFEKFKTSNFEKILGSLSIAANVLSVINMENPKVLSYYSNIKQALTETMKEIHIPWLKVKPKLNLINSALQDYISIYSVNYDLIIYWAILEGAGDIPFKDFFWSEENSFNPLDIEVSSENIKVFYLHGGLHLESLPNGLARKRTNSENATILDQFGLENIDRSVPLIVTEGTVEQKMETIRKSSYLSFAYKHFAENNEPLVIIGHSLSEFDKHLIDAINKRRRCLAISIYSKEKEKNVKIIKEINAKFPNIEPVFFDASTHPLTSPILKVQ